MFGRRRRRTASALGEGFVQVGRHARLEGRLEGQGLVLVHGQFSGELLLSGELIVAGQGEADISTGAVDALRVEGRIGGKLVVHGTATIAHTGQARGELSARKLDASPDAVVSAALRIDP